MNGRFSLSGLAIALTIGLLAYLALDAARDRGDHRRSRAPERSSAEAPATPPALTRENASAPAFGSNNTAREARSPTDRDSLPVDDYDDANPFDYDESETPSRERVQRAFVAAIADSFPDYRLSSDEVERATDALVKLRSTQEALRTLPFDREHAEERRVLVETIGDATTEFSAVLGMDPAEFTARAARGGGGVDFDDGSFDADGPIESEFLEPRR